MFRALVDYESGAIRQRISDLLGRIRVLAERGEDSDAKKISEMTDQFERLVVNIGGPSFKNFHLDHRETATFQKMNQIMEAADDDIRAVYREVRGLSEMLTRTFNINQSILDGVGAELQRGASLVLTAGIEGSIPQRGMFVAADIFNDESLMDLNESTAEVGFGGGALTLERTEVVSIDTAGASVEVDADDKTIGAEGIRVLSPYEGKLYAAPIDEVRPEAGRLRFTNNGKSLAATKEDDLTAARRVILDSNPDTFWQVERVVISDIEEPDPGQIDDNLQYDFEVALTISLREPQVISAITLDPLQFGSRAYMEVRTIETSIDGQEWNSVPGLHDYNFYNILTDEANKQLNDNVSNAVMSPSKYSYQGRGLWVFPAREIRFVRMRLIQKTPVPAPYQTLTLVQKQTTQTTKTSGSILGIGGKKKTKTKTQYRNIDLSYIESLAVVFGERDAGGLDTGAGVRAEAGVNVDIPGVGSVFSGGSKTVSKSGYTLQGVEVRERENAVRYAVGIRDIELLTALYTPESVYVSRPFDIPNPIRQLQLRAAHTIPEEFGEGSWVRYLVSVDDGVNWDEIAPIDQAPIYEDGGRIPTTILINSGTPEEAKDARFGYRDIGEPATSVRVRIELSRPSNLDGGTPIINRYAVQVLTEASFEPVAI